MTPTSAPDLPENYEQLKDYVLNIHAESHQWVINGIKQTFAWIEKFGFTLTRPQSEASAEALELAEIRERWKSRAWPSIGYFVHGQAYQDIQKLLEIIDGK